MKLKNSSLAAKATKIHHRHAKKTGKDSIHFVLIERVNFSSNTWN